jgi:signal transduction histidine kinase
MSKETAHQLGTPLSSLVGWLEVLKENLSNDPKNNDVLLNMEKDLNRLNLVADRFGKIGSKPKLELEQLLPILKNNVEYYQTRAPKNVKISLNHSEKDFEIFINKPLFEWVLENLIRNALDAMQGEGTIEIETASIEPNYIAIDLKDNGKGIPEHLHSKIFDPGFTTKKRGWGLGLSLCKRIVEEYFEGSIFVKSSKLNEGTVFRILLKNKF